MGSGFDRDDLDRAGAGEADALAAVTSGDNSNILTARIARETYEIPNVVARIYDPRRAEIYQRLGIPTVATVTWTIDQVHAPAAARSGRRGMVATPPGDLVLVERVLPEAWAGKALRDLEHARARSSVVAVTRAGVPRLDVADLVGQEGDVLHLAVLEDAVGELERRFDGGDSTSEGRAVGSGAVKVAIAGAGSVGHGHRQGPAANGHDVLAHRAGPRPGGAAAAHPRRHLGGGRRLRGVARSTRPGWPRSTWWWRPPATTRTTS